MLSVKRPSERNLRFYNAIEVAMVVEVKTTSKGDTFGLVADEFAKIRAPMCVGSVTPHSDREWLIEVNGKFFAASPFDDTMHKAVCPDGYNESAILLDCQRPRYLLLLGMEGGFFDLIDAVDDSYLWPWCKSDEKRLPSASTAHLSGTSYWYFLALTPTGGRREFRRIGMMVLTCRQAPQVSEYLRLWTLLDRNFCCSDVQKELYEEVDDRFF
jgi:hypothetical protein